MFLDQGLLILQKHIHDEPPSGDGEEIIMTNLLLGCLDFCLDGISKPYVDMPS